MMDLCLHDKDLKLQNNDLVLCDTDIDALAQAIKIRLKTFFGEWFLDASLGVPYLTQICGQKRSPAFMRNLILPQIESLSAIKTVSSFSIEVDSERTAKIKFSAVLFNQQSITFSEAVEI